MTKSLITSGSGFLVYTWADPEKFPIFGCFVLLCFVLFFSHQHISQLPVEGVLIDFSLTVKAETLIFISGLGSAISSAEEWKSGFIYNLVKS